MNTSTTSKESFSAPPQICTADGLLFDNDGTIIDSTSALVKNWYDLGKEIGIDPDLILSTSHGRRSIDILKLHKPERATWDYVTYMEGRIPKVYGSDAVEIPGSRELLENVKASGVPWMIVTSATRPLVSGWLDVMKLEQPPDLVTAEDIAEGKPDPACYLLGREKLGLADTAEMLVLEDAPSGVRAGKNAGFKVIALATTHKVEQLLEAGADWIVEDMRSVRLQRWDAKTKKVEVEISRAFTTQ